MLPTLPESSGRSVLIGVDGLGGSGKSTYALKLLQSLKSAYLFHLDDLIHPEKVRYNAEHEEWFCYYQLQWRYEYLNSELLTPLKNGLEVKRTLELYDKETDSYSEQEIEIPLGSTVIIEGVFLQRPELRPYFDYVIYLDVNRQTRLSRVLERDTYIGSREKIIDKYEHRYFPAEEIYMRECNPLLLADYIQKA
ncbi:nucleoside/nucleotide kinase family protein [Sporosarcina cascadiensis]|uniref:uridine kinase n=1 Tax=Sporosarcina cascadiensis TaxID=2660747 RepID=UPI00129B4566|nr:uridine kinase [Sporosarcina cascadiensis]